MDNIKKNKILPDNSQSKPMKLSEKIVNPKRDWKILLGIFLFLIIAAAGFDFYMYREIANGDMYVSVNKSDIIVESLKTADLQKILNNFEAKKTLVTTLKMENLVDPSL